MLSKSCALSQGHPSGERSLAMISTSRWNFSPALELLVVVIAMGRGPPTKVPAQAEGCETPVRPALP